MFICKRKCELLGYMTLILLILILLFFSLHLNCVFSFNNNNCFILLFFTILFLFLFMVYLSVWCNVSKKNNKVYPIVRKKVLNKEVVRLSKPNNNKYRVFKSGKEISFDNIIV